MIRTGQAALSTFEYSPSRPPGYLVPELIIGFTSLFGKYYLSNLISALMGTLALFLFWRFLRNHFNETNAAVICLIVGLNPYYVIAASSSMDYIYSIFFGFLGIALLNKRRLFPAAFCIALCLSCRLSNALIVSAIYLFFALRYVKVSSRKQTIRLMSSMIFAMFVTAALYIPSFVAYDYGFGFLTYAIMDWSFLELLYRFIYKNIYLFGLLPLLFICASTFFVLSKRNMNTPMPFAALGISIIALQELLFLKVPAEILYLLPLLFIIVPLWAILIQSKRSLILALLFLTVLSNIIKFDILDIKYNPRGTDAVDANIGLFVRRGVLIADLQERKESEQFFSEGYGILGSNKLVVPSNHIGIK